MAQMLVIGLREIYTTKKLMGKMNGIYKVVMMFYMASEVTTGSKVALETILSTVEMVLISYMVIMAMTLFTEGLETTSFLGTSSLL